MGDPFFPFLPLLGNAVPLLWGAVLAAAALGTGLRVLSLLRPAGAVAGEGFRALLALALGLGVLSLAATLLGAAGLLRPSFLTLLALLALALAVRPLALWWNGAGRGFPSRLGEAFRAHPLPLGITALFLAVGFLFALVPVTAFDALAYHLEVPARFLQGGGIIHLPENPSASYPLLGEMLYALAMGVSTPVLAQLLHYLFFLLALGLAWSWARRALGEEAAAWGVALLATLPPFFMEAWAAGSDWTAAAFTLGAVLLLASGERSPRGMGLAGVLAGMAAGCKYPALGFAIAVPMLAGAATDLAAGARGRKLALPWLLFSGVALLLFSPWALKNLLLEGNALFPLFGSGGLAAPGGLLAGDTHRASLSLASLWGGVTFPWRAVFDAKALGLNWSVGILPLALILALPALRGGGERKAGGGSRFLLLWGVLCLLLWSFTFQVGRLLLPAVAVACLGLGASLAALRARVGAAFRGVLGAVAAALLLADLGMVVALQDRLVGSLSPALGVTAPREHLTADYPPYAALEHLNRLTPPPRVLFLGETRGFYAGFPREVPLYAVENRLLHLIRGGNSPTEAAAALRAAGFTHLLVHPREWERLALLSPLLRLTPGEKEAVAAFLSRHTREAFSDSGVSVREIEHE